jgi:hypothetical protein
VAMIGTTMLARGSAVHGRATWQDPHVGEAQCSLNREPPTAVLVRIRGGIIQVSAGRLFEGGTR